MKQRIPIYQVDAFTSKLFKGNPAAVCILERWIETERLQQIAAENNLSETAFIVEKAEQQFELRWFTPITEVDLCGHATLATAKVLFTYYYPKIDRLTFSTSSGELAVNKEDTLLTLDFPARIAKSVPVPLELVRALGRAIPEVYLANDYLVIFDRYEDVETLNPDLELLKKLDAFGLIVSAPGKNEDFVSRYFAPKEGINEDPVTGSAHCTLAPYWGQRLNKDRLLAKQISKRGGELYCQLKENRVLISGEAVIYLEGIITV